MNHTKCFLVFVILLIGGLRSMVMAQTEKVKELIVSSKSFECQGVIPSKYSYKGGNVSPHLAWTQGPTGTKTYAVICDDPDAPRAQPWVHWVVFNIPASKQSLAEGLAPKEKNDSGMQQGLNDYEQIGWGGPNPPSGTHRYYFTVYALDVVLSDLQKPIKKELLQKMKGHILAQGQCMGTVQASA
jgi:Raf kinase inhibitor-like YbhB/YbcL family protein